jgi:hypothetical protein
MEESLRFGARCWTMTEVSRDFGIPCKNRLEIFDRYKEYGLKALGEDGIRN